MTSAGWNWVRVAVVLLVLLGLAAAWRYTGLREWADPHELAEIVQPYRKAWYSFPATVLVFVVTLLFMFPLLVLVFVCGIVFGPWLGPFYAMSGALAGAVLPFYIGRRVGRERIERIAGGVVKKVDKMLERRGVVAVFLVRKVPLNYTLTNMICGASGVAFRDFLLGSLLGTGGAVIVITVFGAQLMDMLADPQPGHVAVGVGIVAGLALLALLMQYLVNRKLVGKDEHGESDEASARAGQKFSA
jgi:phospholipase D1/2